VFRLITGVSRLVWLADEALLSPRLTPVRALCVGCRRRSAGGGGGTATGGSRGTSAPSPAPRSTSSRPSTSASTPRCVRRPAGSRSASHSHRNHPARFSYQIGGCFAARGSRKCLTPVSGCHCLGGGPQDCRESQFRAYWFSRNDKIIDRLLADRSSVICLQVRPIERLFN
jgi:hypothetical protein